MLELEFIPKDQTKDSTFIQIKENTYDEIKSIFEWWNSRYYINVIDEKLNDFEKYIIWDGEDILDIKYLD
jgi:hypothetical protein